MIPSQRYCSNVYFFPEKLEECEHAEGGGGGGGLNAFDQCTLLVRPWMGVIYKCCNRYTHSILHAHAGKELH